MARTLQHFFLIAGLFLTACQHRQKVSDTELGHASWQETLAWAQAHLPHHGTLVQEKDGYAYVKVDDGYIKSLFPMLHASAFQKPPYFRRPDAPGAHISLAYENEQVALKEVGRTFTFELESIKVVHAKKGISYIVLTVKAPELENLRKRYGLSPLLQGHEFHITLAKRNVR